MTPISVAIARCTILTCLVGASIPLYYSYCPTPTISAWDIATYGVCLAVPGAAPFLLFGLSAQTWRQNFAASLVVAVATIVAVAVGNLIWWAWGSDPEDLDVLTAVILTPPAQMLIYGVARFILLVTVERERLARNESGKS